MKQSSFFIDLLTQLVSIPSQSQKEEACAIFLTQFLRDELGMDAELRRVEGDSCNVAAVLRGGSGAGPEKGRRLLLGGHIDTVAPAEGWRTDPFQLALRGGRAYGLGAADMKGGLAAQIAVLKRLIDEGVSFGGTIEFAALCDEERYSIGAEDYIKRKKAGGNAGQPHADFAVLAEPHFDPIVAGAAGKVLLRLQVTGAQGHAANPETGVNAIDCMAAFLCAVNRRFSPLYLEGRAASHCVLRIESKYEGYSLNIPEECCALLNKQLSVEEDAEEFIAELKGLYREQVGRGALKIFREIPYYPSYRLDAENKDLCTLLSLLKRQFGFSPQLRINQSVSDANLLSSRLGVPAVLFGPEGHNYHKADEYIVLSSAYRYMDMLYEFLRAFFQ